LEKFELESGKIFHNGQEVIIELYAAKYLTFMSLNLVFSHFDSKRYIYTAKYSDPEKKMPPVSKPHNSITPVVSSGSKFIIPPSKNPPPAKPPAQALKKVMTTR
jgi:hypothetical protein